MSDIAAESEVPERRASSLLQTLSTATLIQIVASQLKARPQIVERLQHL